MCPWVYADLHGRPYRHQRAWLSPSWKVHLAAALSVEALAALGDWFARGLPAMVSRGADDDTGGVALSVTLPAARWYATVQLRVGRAAIARVAPPLPLAETLPSAPEAWRAPLDDLAHAAAGLGVPLSVVGTLAWQHLTAEPYVTPRSTVELLFRPGPRRQLDGVLALLRVREEWDGPPLAGEAVLGWNDAVAWRDLTRGRRRVLVRSAGNEAVVDVDRLLAGLRG
jgi:phosphoribosyl-dephospho-CoA transferase